MLTRAGYTALVLAVGLQRLWETRRSRAHSHALLQGGAAEHARGQMPWMITVHALWLAAMLYEVWGLGAEPRLLIALPAAVLFIAGQSLRLLAMRELGERWTVTVVTPTDGRPPITTGIYRYLRHPNYLGVILEIAALPALHGAYLTSIVFSVANGVLLAFRIREEERAIDTYGDYRGTFSARPRLIPKFSGQRAP